MKRQRRWRSAVLTVGAFVALTTAVATAVGASELEHGIAPPSLWIHDVMLVRGNGTPARGPTGILIEDGRIVHIGRRPDDAQPAVELDGTGKWVIPGLINMHGHIMESRAGSSMPLEYQMNLWLSAGITTIRDLGSEFDRSLEIRQQSRDGTLVAPRIFLYPFLSRVNTPQEAKARVVEFHEKGADGVKLYSLDRDVLDAAVAEAKARRLRTTIHIGVEETNAWDIARLGLTSIEHWYGIPDAALDGVQSFPADYSYSDELDRFRWAGRLWREINPERLDELLDAMIEANVAWDPTFAIYEASRDLVRAQNKPWFRDYLHPTLEEFFVPNLENHGSYFVHWTNTDEAYWRENYQIWMAAVREFARRGGTVCCGEDAGFIYVMFGFGLLRELELHEEAGFHPLEVIQHATENAARVLGQEGELGRVRPGYAADLLVVNGNPLEDLGVLYPAGSQSPAGSTLPAAGGIEWTIKAGIPYHVPTMTQRVKEIVADAREARQRDTDEKTRAGTE